MAEQQKPDMGNRIVLIVLGVVALLTIGGAIIATTTEWNTGAHQQAAETGEATEEEILPSAGY
ncbi:hypothetical protein [Pelagibacterium limicola]|uniref:hypothetical protein n=1 Tax=Pelagibacterium limicola TaxID=2791022 RepID=UPI0018AFD27D|nr:hypothetical protein [Pelagibacterium limicola]